MSNNSKKPLRVRDLVPYLPLLFFIIWESGAVHAYLQLMTPLYVVSLVSGLSLLIFFAWPRFEKARVLGPVIFFLLFLIRDPVPYIFLLLVVVYYFYRNEYLLKTAFILLPLTVVDGLGLNLGFWLMLLITLAFSAIAVLYNLQEADKRELKPLTKAALYISLILILISFSPIDPLAQKKDGKILYDGFHHGLDSAFFDNDTITHATLRYLESVGYDVSILDKAITPETIKGASILVLETPEDEYSEQEIESIVDFVREGGGLFVLGDHTNIMDCYNTLNPILNRFGLHLNFDYSMLWEPHFASIAGFDSMEETAGATLDANRYDAHVLYSLKYTTWADLGDWAAQDHAYMGNVEAEDNEEYGVLPICVTAGDGKGRVLAIANSDSMSGPNLLYNYDFISRVMSYLNYENSFLKSTWFRLLLALLILLGVYRARLGAVKPFMLSVALVLALVQVQAALPVTSDPANMIALDVGHSNIEGYGHPHQYKNVFLAIFAQHYGFNPVLVKTVPDDLENYAAYVTMGPTSSFSSGEVEKLLQYVQNGGTLVVFDGFHAEIPSDPGNAAANSLLSPFGLYLNDSVLGELSYFNYTTWGYNLPYMKEIRIGVRPLQDPLMDDVYGNITMYSATEVLGGSPIAMYGNSTPAMALERIGDGKVIVVGDHTIFRNFVEYEPIFSYPDPNLKKFIENLFESLGGREQDGI
jgi:hypothetical protein